jgi:hypothetical protein
MAKLHKSLQSQVFLDFCSAGLPGGNRWTGAASGSVPGGQGQPGVSPRPCRSNQMGRWGYVERLLKGKAKSANIED